MRQAGASVYTIAGTIPVPKKVSIVIPCFNSERWIGEAIQSCLDQTYRPIEVTVVDDGSTDKSQSRIMSYVQAYPDIVRCVPSANGGPSAARNRGLESVSGAYIQYLDADDLLVPEKLAMQVLCLESNPDVDVVYGDWRYLIQDGIQSPRLSDVCVMTDMEEPLEAHLSGWWAPLNAFLSRAETATRWDSTTLPYDDHDYWIQVAMNRHAFLYQPGCVSIYRIYGNASFSQAVPLNGIKGHGRILEKAERQLKNAERLEERYKRGLAQFHFVLMQACKGLDEDLFRYHKNKVFELDPTFKPRHKNALYRALHGLLGLEWTEALALQRRRILKRSKSASC